MNKKLSKIRRTENARNAAERGGPNSAQNKLGNLIVAEESKLDPREVFKKEKRRFVSAVKIAISVSKAAAGREPGGNIVMASYVFTRMCVAADTLLYVLQRDIGKSKELTLDHYSIGVLAAQHHRVGANVSLPFGRRSE